VFFVCVVVNRFAYRADEVQCNHLFAWVRVPLQRDGSSKPLLQIDWESVQHVHIRGQEWQGLKSRGSGSASRIVIKLQWHGSSQGCYKNMLQIVAAHKNGSFMALLHQNLVRGFESYHIISYIISYHIVSYHNVPYRIVSYHIIYFPSVNLYRITWSIRIWKSSYLLGLRGDINTSVYNSHMVI